MHEVVDSEGNIIKIKGGETANPTSLASVDDAGAISPLSTPEPNSAGRKAVAFLHLIYSQSLKVATPCY